MAHKNQNAPFLRKEMRCAHLSRFLEGELQTALTSSVAPLNPRYRLCYDWRSQVEQRVKSRTYCETAFQHMKPKNRFTNRTPRGRAHNAIHDIARALIVWINREDAKQLAAALLARKAVSPDVICPSIGNAYEHHFLAVLVAHIPGLMRALKLESGRKGAPKPTARERRMLRSVVKTLGRLLRQLHTRTELAMPEVQTAHPELAIPCTAVVTETSCWATSCPREKPKRSDEEESRISISRLQKEVSRLKEFGDIGSNASALVSPAVASAEAFVFTGVCGICTDGGMI